MHTATVSGHTFNVVLWKNGDPFPAFATSVGVDTETTLVDENNSVPLLAYTGIYNPADNTAYIADHRDSLILLDYLCQFNCFQYYFNVAFDFLVLQKEGGNAIASYWTAADNGYVVDVGTRASLFEISTIGYVPYWTYSLKDMCDHYLKYKMDKGKEKGAEADRLTFSPDKEITDSQMVYLGIDCYTTWALSSKIKPMPTEDTHSRGAIVLGALEHNGFAVDNKVRRHIINLLEEDKEQARRNLISFGFPDPEKGKGDDSDKVMARVRTAITKFISTHIDVQNYELTSANPDKVTLIRALLYSVAYMPDKIRLANLLLYVMNNKIGSPLNSKERSYRDKILDSLDAGVYVASRKKSVLPLLIARLLEELVKDDVKTFQEAYDLAEYELQGHSEWFSAEPKKGPKAFMQEHLRELVRNNKDLILPRTEKTKDLKLAKDDMWLLEDLGINDPFLIAYTEYYHLRKFYNTYLKDEYICSDGKVHPRFTNILRTGRTSCSKPNIQNLPSREKKYVLKNMFIPPEGMVLCATDFSFIELCAFAQSCYKRFSVSVMRDVINAGVDPHRWFAGVMYKVIEPDVTILKNKEKVKALMLLLEQSINDEQRQRAKAANFGLPGGMQAERFYKHCRSQGIKITRKDAKEMCESWYGAFQEMKNQLITDPAKTLSEEQKKLTDRYYGMNTEEEDEEEQEYEAAGLNYSQSKSATLINGMVRNRCSPNSAMNIQFQGLTAAGAKEAGWELLKLGLLNNLCNFVHDEYLYWLPKDQLKTMVPKIEEAMLRGMRKVIPDVTIGVETTVMTHWDKKAMKFAKLEFDEYGMPLGIEDPPFVQKLNNNAS